MLNYPPSVDALVDTLFDEDDSLVESSNKAYNIRVIKYYENKSSINWVVKRTCTEFVDNHQYLVKKLGLLKNFSFDSHKSSSVFHFYHEDCKSLDESKIKEYLKELCLLNPIPMVVVSFLGLENVTLAEKSTSFKGSHKHSSGTEACQEFGSHHNLSALNVSDTNVSSEESPMPLRSSTYIDGHEFFHERQELHKKHHHRASWKGKIGGSSDIRHHSLHDFIHCHDQELIAKCCLFAVFAGFLHSIIKGLWIFIKFVGNFDLLIAKQSTNEYVKASLLRSRYFLEGVVLTLLALMFIHKLFGFIAGHYFRHKLKTHIDGRYNVHFNSICFRLGAGKNQVIFSGFEWRNPPLFNQTPYFIHIDEISFTFDLMSLYDAFFRFKSIKVYEICISNCNVYIEKIHCPNSSTSVNGEYARTLSSNGESEHGVDRTHEVEYRVNMWAAVGKLDYKELRDGSSAKSKRNSTSSFPKEESSSLLRRTSSRGSLLADNSSTNGSSKATSFNTRSLSVDNHVGSDAVTRLRQDLLNEAGGSEKIPVVTVGGLKKSNSMHRLNSIQSDNKEVRRHSTHGISSLFHSSHHKHHHADHKTASHNVSGGDLSSSSHSDSNHHDRRHSSHNGNKSHDSRIKPSVDFEGIKRVDSTYSLNSADSFSEINPSNGLHSAVSIDNDDGYSHYDIAEDNLDDDFSQTSSKLHHRRGHSAGFLDHSDVKPHLTENELAYQKNKRLFGFPYRLDIQLLVFKNLQMHISDLLNASHVDHTNCSTIKLNMLTMSHEELTKPPTSIHNHHRKGVYMDEVMWRTVNCAMNELLKTNKVTLLSIFASAAANQTAAAVRNLAKRLFRSGKE